MKCTALTKDGSPCNGFAMENSEYCFTHNPEVSGDRAIARHRGGLNRRAPHGGDMTILPAQIRTMADLALLLDFTLAEAVSLENSVARGRLFVALVTAYREVLESGALEQRLEALEALLLGKETLK